MAIKVCEIFYSIQGESTWSGQPCVFVRLTGCNLKCSYCDTGYAYDGGVFMEIPEILDRVRGLRCNLVEVTGGEPLIQPETVPLIRAMLDDGLTVLLETNGSMDIGVVDPRCVRIVDIKCPSSGMAEHNDLQNLRKLAAHDELKFVIGNRADFEFARNFLTFFPPFSCRINFSPVSGSLDPRTLAEWILEDRLPVRLNLQLHKIVKMQ
jgi:7-carboxy-7-deazaguanine synthase